MCGGPLREISRFPVCSGCLAAPVPLTAEYVCVCCRAPFVNAHPLDDQGRCAACRLGLRGFDAAFCYGAYEATLRKLIHVFKYGRVPSLAGPLSGFLAGALPGGERFHAITPVPLHWRRRLSRGFNQSKLLAAALSRRLGLPVVDVVRRRRPTNSQAGLSAAARRANVNGAFRVKTGRPVRGLRILLVDDVMTTGATARACAAALKTAGAAHVTLLTVARADRRMAIAAEPRISSFGGFPNDA